MQTKTKTTQPALKKSLRKFKTHTRYSVINMSVPGTIHIVMQFYALVNGTKPAPVVQANQLVNGLKIL